MLAQFVPAALALLLAAGGLSWRMERFHQAEGQARWIVPRGDVVRAIATDFENLLADSFWLQFLQYNGEKLTEDPLERRYENLLNGFYLMTDLDPHFRDAYLFGSWVLGDAGEADGAVALLRRGRERHPADPWYAHQLGYIEFLYRRNLAGAIAAFGDAERLFGQGERQDPRMALRCAKMKAYLAEKHDRRDLAVRTWRGILASARKAGDKHMVGIAENALRRLGVTE
ncbi:MAG: hypothetical protein FJZ01_12045 [Candidatus Sericytochromatia bacterium]|nr:hypothetical protein [Candidatus Tanganyikabacteria bacterium]